MFWFVILFVSLVVVFVLGCGLVVGFLLWVDCGGIGGFGVVGLIGIFWGDVGLLVEIVGFCRVFDWCGGVRCCLELKGK